VSSGEASILHIRSAELNTINISYAMSDSEVEEPTSQETGGRQFTSGTRRVKNKWSKEEVNSLLDSLKVPGVLDEKGEIDNNKLSEHFSLRSTENVRWKIRNWNDKLKAIANPTKKVQRDSHFQDAKNWEAILKEAKKVGDMLFLGMFRFVLSDSNAI
jgi:hypothetical protein